MELEDKKLERLATFSNYANKNNVFICDLVRLGYVYVGYDDALKCTGCRQTYSTWTNIEDLINLHNSTAQHCVFKVGKSSRKIENDHMESISKPNRCLKTKSNSGDSDEQDAVVSSIKNVRYPSYKMVDARIRSFQGAPTILAQSAASAARAGFFFSGYNDHVRCFCCGGTLGEWQEGEDAWEEHAKWFPDCEYLWNNHYYRKRDNKAESDQAFHAAMASDNTRYETENNLDVSEHEHQSTLTPEELMTSDGALAVLEMGYSVDTVKSAIEIWKISSHELRPSSMAIVDVILNNEELDSINQVLSNATAANQVDGAAYILTNQVESTKRTRGTLSHRNETASDGSSVLKPDRVTKITQNVVISRDNQGAGTPQIKQMVVPQHVTEASSTNDQETSRGQSPEPASTNDQETSRGQSPKPASTDDQETSRGQSPKPASTDDQETSRGQSPKPASTLQKDEHDTSEYSSIQREARHLQDLTQCKICMAAGVNIVFMPCGHIATCSHCSKGIKKCPVCRQKIKGTITAYMS